MRSLRFKAGLGKRRILVADTYVTARAGSRDAWILRSGALSTLPYIVTYEHFPYLKKPTIHCNICSFPALNEKICAAEFLQINQSFRFLGLIGGIFDQWYLQICNTFKKKDRDDFLQGKFKLPFLG